MREQTQKGMWKRTFGLFRNIRIPWGLYLLQVILGIVSTKVSLLYIPYESKLKLGNIDDLSVVWAYIGLLLLSVAMQMAASIPEFYASAQVARNLQNKLIYRSVRLPMASFEGSASQLVSWITQDCTYADGLLTSIIGFLTGAVSTYLSVTSMSAIDTTMVSVVPILLCYVVFSTWFEGKMLFLRERKDRWANGRLTAYMAEHLSFFTQIKQLHSREEEAKRGEVAIRDYYKAEVYQAVLTLVNNLVSGSLTSVITILVFLLGVPKVNAGTMTLEDLAAFQSYIMIAYQSFSSLPGLYTNFMYYNGQLFYISSLMAEKEEVYTRQQGVEGEEELSFRHVSFGYGSQPVLEDVSFTIPKGKKTVIVGPNGTGKTTIFKLIERFYQPDSGEVCFGSQNVETIHLQDWRKNIAYVLQEPQLFRGTIRENISYGVEGEISQAEVERAARLAGADSFIEALPEGYDFDIGEGGSRLSAGQRQRLAIARAVMVNPSYLLLDEATCNMDVYAQQEVTQALEQLMVGRTTVMITHDMSQLEEADHIIVLQNGTVEAEGTREEVLASSATLQRMCAGTAEAEGGLL
jgi:ATP-binding cassette subfamily B protein AbcA/BmrA